MTLLCTVAVPHRIPLSCFLLSRLAFVRWLADSVGQLRVVLLGHGHVDIASGWWQPFLISL